MLTFAVEAQVKRVSAPSGQGALLPNEVLALNLDRPDRA
jgi:hypothetical protein